ncbi:hypothetical protein NCAS_0B04700 [Naumovozyma castellii]|uniref:Nuclear pore protein n=1 Tax=Naumovozyma castellii TaxID=27288 RepID=G0VAM8_NAUCA|nr:hypothetical protein NCAS_0B04700 [Naumovozyma castellii CBS 4309]CCC68554.1 hypothetical protein NCAS_0B04700 [Naumovozyma castellii CBS 4309]
MDNSQGTVVTPSSKGTMKVFSDLIEASKNLPTTSSQLGSIQLSVSEIKRRAIELRKNKDIDTNLTKAHYLLAGSGLAIEDVDTSIKDLRNKPVLEQNVANSSTGNEIDTYLRAKKGENILSSIEQLLSNAAKDFDVFVNQNLNLDWAQRKEEVMENFGIITKGKNSNDHIGDTSLSASEIPKWGTSLTSVLNSGESKLNVNENYAIREKFETYAKIIHQFNNDRQNGHHFSLNKEFISIIQSLNDSKNRQILESWKILEILKGQKDVVATAKSYLQNQFLEYVDILSRKTMNEGLPTNSNKIRSFIDSKLKNSDNTWKIANLTIVNGNPIWAMIFYLLRAGLEQEALEVVENNKSGFKKIEQSFLSYFKAYVSAPDRQLSMEFSSRLHTEYNQHIKSSLNGDPYRLAVYKIIGRCDLTRKNISSVTLSVEDWLWIHLMLIKDNVMGDEPAYERYRLEDFQNTIISYGPSRFGDYYLQVLILSGLYELAVEYAYSLNEIDAVHLAIGLANQGLLSVTSKMTDTLITVENNKRMICIAKVLGNYTKSFKYSDPRIAAEYLVLIALSNDPAQIEICHEALRELVLETKEFSLLLGKINRDGARIPGVIEERQPLLHLQNEKEFLRIITEQAARKADEDGRTRDSLLLYQLSEEYDVVLTIINGLLGDILSDSDLTQPLLTADDNYETNPILLAQKLILMYSDNSEISKQINVTNKETCSLLLQMVEIRKIYSANQWHNVLTQIEGLDILPFSNELSARKKAEQFTLLDENIVKTVPNLLIITLMCISKIVHSLVQNRYLFSETKDQQISFLKNISRNCMAYAGIIQYKMPRETYSTLINLDVAL